MSHVSIQAQIPVTVRPTNPLIACVRSGGIPPSASVINQPIHRSQAAVSSTRRFLSRYKLKS